MLRYLSGVTARSLSTVRIFRRSLAMSASTSSRSYADAIECLNSLQSNAATIEAVRAAGPINDDKIIPETIDYLKRIGYQPEDLNALNVIHITGTKGKGSTSAFCSSILTTLAPSAKVGLYTSPHMVAVRERIRINGKPLEEEKFAKYFFDVWDSYEANTELLYKTTPPKPAYFRYVTMLAYHVFLQEKVDATVLEVGIGGTYDTTNIVPKPLATGITSLGLDHVAILGKTLEEIAHQKSGIYKAGCPAITVKQPPNAMKVLQMRASELKASSFNVVEEHPQLAGLKLGLAGIHQRSNASLAIALVQAFLSSANTPAAFKEHATQAAKPSLGDDGKEAELPHLEAEALAPKKLSDSLVRGLENARWPGRCQKVEDREASRRGVTWFLDGAHTVESLQCCAEWFVQASSTPVQSRKRVLVFNCTSGRSAESLLGTLADAMAETSKAIDEPASGFDHVVFCTNTTYSEGSAAELTSKAVDPQDLANLTVQHELAEAWKRLAGAAASSISSTTAVHVLPSIQHAVEFVAGVNKEEERTDVLVAGSLHLVGGIFEVASLEFAL